MPFVIQLSMTGFMEDGLNFQQLAEVDSCKEDY
jgi:hypothetical protein